MGPRPPGGVVARFWFTPSFTSAEPPPWPSCRELVHAATGFLYTSPAGLRLRSDDDALRAGSGSFGALKPVPKDEDGALGVEPALGVGDGSATAGSARRACLWRRLHQAGQPTGPVVGLAVRQGPGHVLLGLSTVPTWCTKNPWTEGSGTRPSAPRGQEDPTRVPAPALGATEFPAPTGALALADPRVSFDDHLWAVSVIATPIRVPRPRRTPRIGP